VSLDLMLEFIHHVSVFSLVGVVAAEFVLLQPGLGGKRLQLVSTLDRAYGGLAGLIILAGAARVIWGDAGWQFYVMNWTFWTKMGLFLAVGLLSIGPTRQIIRWRRAAEADPGFAVPADEIASARRYFYPAFALLFFIPIFAALMARGIGL
jgi:putative membrane protein